MLRVLMLCAIVAALLGAPGRVLSAPAPQLLTATLTVLSGGVTTYNETDGAYGVGLSGQNLREADHVITAADGHALVTFLDGSEIEMLPSTEITLRTVADSYGGGTVVQVQMSVGEAISRVTQLSGDSSYQFMTPNATALVRGTIFTTRIEIPADNTPTGLETFSVQAGTVDVIANGQTYVLPPGQQLVLQPSGSSGVETVGAPSVATGASPPPPDTRLGIAEGWRNEARFRESGAGTDRLLLSWADLEPDGPASFLEHSRTITSSELQARALDRDLIGLIQFTPAWAARDPDQGQRSVPRDLGDPNGPWSQFVTRLVEHYKGNIKYWMIWNEMDFGAENPDGWSWGGTEAEYWLLLKDAYRAIKAADPDAKVIFGPTTYWVDENQGRDLFLKRVLDVAAADPESDANDWFFDIVGMNIYRAPDDIYRIHSVARDLLDSYGLQRKPLWLTETNCMPFDDPATPKPDDGQRCTLEEQSAFTVQAFAIAYAAGWERALWYQLTDQNDWQYHEAFGLIHDDGSARPAFQAFKVVSKYLTGGERYELKPLLRDNPAWSVWPEDAGSYYPAWLIYQVIVDRGDERVKRALERLGPAAAGAHPEAGHERHPGGQARQHAAARRAVGRVRGGPGPATAHGASDPDGYYYVGGDPVLIVQSGVPAGPRRLRRTRSAGSRYRLSSRAQRGISNRQRETIVIPSAARDLLEPAATRDPSASPQDDSALVIPSAARDLWRRMVIGDPSLRSRWQDTGLIDSSGGRDPAYGEVRGGNDGRNGKLAPGSTRWMCASWSTTRSTS